MDGGADWDEMTFRLGVQDGLISREQLRELGASYGDVQRLVRRRELVRVSPGVFIDHTGELNWTQRAWAAVLACRPAALSHESAWKPTPLVHVAIAHGRRIAAPPGVVLHRMRCFEERVEWHRSPPRLSFAEAAICAAGDAPDELGAIALLGDVVQRRLTTAGQLQLALDRRARMPRGRWLIEVLGDLATGANSALEHGYLVRVERAHGLPVGERQVTGSNDGRRTERDVVYRDHDLVVELDGRTGHDDAASRDRDLDRDLAAQVDEHRRTVRLGWGQVFRRSCLTAARVASLLERGGWEGPFRRCPHCP